MRKHLLLLSILISSCSLLHAAKKEKIVLTRTESPVPFNKLSYVVGSGWNDDPELRLVRVADGLIGTPGKTREYLNDMIKSATGKEIEALQQYENILTVKLPNEQFGVAIIFSELNRDVTQTLLINQPELHWLSKENVNRGDTIRALGQNLVPIEEYPQRNREGLPVSHAGYLPHNTTVLIKDANGKFSRAPVVQASSYDVHFIIPESLTPGSYQVYLHNGQGGKLGWSEGQKLLVQEKEEWPVAVFNVKDYGAVGDGRNDDTGAIEKAIADIRKNEGGVLYFPAGGYHFNRTLRLPPYTVLKGESKERSWLYMPDGFHTNATDSSATIGIAGEGAVGLENLSIHAVYVKMLLVAPVTDTLPSSWLDYSSLHDPYVKVDVNADGSFIKNCKLFHNYTHLYHRRPDKEKLVNEFARSKFNLVVLLKGDYISVTDSEIIGRQSCVYLCDSKYSIIANNQMQSGYGGNNIGLQHGTAGYEKVIIEDNNLSGFSPMHHGSVWMMHGGRYVSMFRNKVNMKTWVSDNEGLLGHMWGYRLPFFIKKAYADRIEIDMKKWEEYWAKIEKQAPHLMQYTPFQRRNKSQNDFSIYLGHELQVFRGTGLGQTNTVKSVKKNVIYFEKPFKTPLDNSSYLVVHDAPAFRYLTFADNYIEDTGQAIFLWGHSHESIIDGNITKRTGPIGPWTVFHAYSVAGGCHFFQMINNYMDEGRYYLPGEHQPGGRYAQGGIGAHYSCESEWASSGGALNSVGYIVRNNHFANDNSVNYGGYDYTWCGSKIDESKENEVNKKDMVALMFEDNTIKNAHYGMVFGSSVNAVLLNNHFDNVTKTIKGAEFDGILDLDKMKIVK